MQIRQETTVGIFILAAIGALFILSTYIGFFRFDKVRYNSYFVAFNDVSGLSKKADVKIAGVKVGWVDQVNLFGENPIQVKASVMVLKDFKLKTDAYAKICQEGILGNKYLEIVPGSPGAAELKSGETLSKQSKEPVAMDDMMYKVQEIANNVQEVSNSLKEVFAGNEGISLLKTSVQNFSNAAQKINDFSNSLDRILCNNEQNINGIVIEFKSLVKDLKEQLPNTIKNIDQDISKVTTQVSEIAEKINSGKGFIGKLINEDDTYKDIQCTVKGVKSYFDKIGKLTIVSDIHSETMSGLAEKFCFRDNKGVFNLRMHPNEDYFYLAGITTSQKGYLVRTESTSEYFDEKGDPILPSVENQRPQTATIMVSTTKNKTELLDDWRFNLQFGKIFSDAAFRIGLFEGFSGLAVDYEVPMAIDNFRWVTTLEAYDFRGRNHYFNDARPHLKWLNRMFIGRNIYIVFGADDFVSKWNKNIFFGAGIRFADDDLKYFMPAGVSIIG